MTDASSTSTLGDACWVGNKEQRDEKHLDVSMLKQPKMIEILYSEFLVWLKLCLIKGLTFRTILQPTTRGCLRGLRGLS